MMKKLNISDAGSLLTLLSSDKWDSNLVSLLPKCHLNYPVELIGKLFKQKKQRREEKEDVQALR